MRPDKDGCNCYDETARACPVHGPAHGIKKHSWYCCPVHGCKYDDATCPVVSGQSNAEYKCEDCADEEEIRHHNATVPSMTHDMYTHGLEEEIDRLQTAIGNAKRELELLKNENKDLRRSTEQYRMWCKDLQHKLSGIVGQVKAMTDVF